MKRILYLLELLSSVSEKKKFIVLEKITVKNIEVTRSSMQEVQELALCSTAARPPLQNKHCDAALN